MAHGGTIIAYLGDGLMAAFGAPIEQPDHADRALAAARELVGTTLPALNAWMREQGYGDGFRMGVGVNSGSFISGNVGHERRLEYTAIGDVCNTASRIEGLTKGTRHQLLFSDATLEALTARPDDLVDFGETRDPRPPGARRALVARVGLRRAVARQDAGMPAELIDVAPGLWLWRMEHPAWRPGLDWERLVTSTCVESRGEVVLLDPLAPPDDAAEVWARIEARPPTAVAILKPDHIRDVDLFVAPLRRPRVRAAAVLARRHPGDRARADRARERAARRARRAVRRPRPQRDAALAAGAARARLRRRADGARRRAARLGDAVARGARRCPRSVRCSSFRSSTWSSRTASPCTAAPSSSSRSSARPGRADYGPPASMWPSAMLNVFPHEAGLVQVIRRVIAFIIIRFVT